MLDLCFDIGGSPCFDQRKRCSLILGNMFLSVSNYPAAVKYLKLAYESCIRSADYTELEMYKREFLSAKEIRAQEPALRFTVGDEVEFLHELETGIKSEWMLGKVVELHYRERDFDITFNAPYRLQVLNNTDGKPPVYAWVKADLDRYVRKVGVRAMEDTRYQARLDAKLAELDQVFCYDSFPLDIYRELVQDQKFVDIFKSTWAIELSVNVVECYRVLVMYGQPLVRIASGYHVTSTEEIIAGIKAYFNPAYKCCVQATSAGGWGGDSKRVRTEILSVLQGTYSSDTPGFIDHWDRVHCCEVYETITRCWLMAGIFLKSILTPSIGDASSLSLQRCQKLCRRLLP